MRVERDAPVRAVGAVGAVKQVQSDDLFETIPPLAFLMQRKPHRTDCVDARAMGTWSRFHEFPRVATLNRPRETLQFI